MSRGYKQGSQRETVSYFFLLCVGIPHSSSPGQTRLEVKAQLDDTSVSCIDIICTIEVSHHLLWLVF